MRDKIKMLIIEYISNYPNEEGTETKWQEPLIAFAKADDKDFLKLKELISPTHALPKDFLDDAKTVISYFVPFEENVVKSNIEGKDASRAWAVAYIETNKLILDIAKYMKTQLNSMGYNSVVIPATHNFDKEKLISDWSHRHIAYFSGLGSFGLNNMLITEKGCCGRVGSFVTNLEIEPSEKVMKEYCLYKYNGSCKKCVDRCVTDALSTDYYDRHKCYEVCLHNDKLYPDLSVSDVCGKCLVGIPCSFKNPVRK